MNPVFSGEAGGKVEKTNRARYTVTNVKILQGQSLLSRKKLFKKKKSLRVWLYMPVCCPTLERGNKYIFVGKMNDDKQLVIPKHRGLVLEWRANVEKKLKRQLKKCF